MKFLYIFSILQISAAFIGRSFVPRTASMQRNMVATGVQPNAEEKSGLTELIQMILEALPLAINTPSPEMNKDKLIDNPPRFFKPTSASKFRKAHSSDSAWKTQDIINEFNERYGIGSKGFHTLKEQQTSAAKIAQSTLEKMVLNEKQALVELLDELEEMDLIDNVDEHLNNSPSLTSAEERYIADATITAFTKLDKPINRAKVVQNPKRFVKAMTLKDIKKKLKEDPFFFQH